MNGFNPDNDADWDTVEFESIANRFERMAIKGICLHGHIMDTENIHKCLACDKEWGTSDIMWAEIDKLRGEHL